MAKVFRIAVAFVILIILTTPTDINGAEQSDGATDTSMVLIPGGEFRMGSEGEHDFSPPHTVILDSFYIDKHEVTNAEYHRFCQETVHRLPEFWGMDTYHCGPNYPNYPVVGVSWSDAKAYAEWAGKRLPTEAEWEYAARGGMMALDYPTANDLDSTMANFKSSGTVQVGSYPPNGFGLFDMAGNANEWVADFYDGDYYKTSPTLNPPGPEHGKFKVFRGGGWHSGKSCNRVFFRNALPPNWVDFNVSFRCVKDCW